MNQTVCVLNGFTVLLDGNAATVMLPKPKCPSSRLTEDSAMEILLTHMKAERVCDYLVSEGFIDGKILPKIKSLGY